MNESIIYTPLIFLTHESLLIQSLTVNRSIIKLLNLILLARDRKNWYYPRTRCCANVPSTFMSRWICKRLIRYVRTRSKYHPDISKDVIETSRESLSLSRGILTLTRTNNPRWSLFPFSFFSIKRFSNFRALLCPR